MKSLVALILFVSWLLVGFAMTACTDDSGSTAEYYENDIHGGYPGPGTRTQNRDD